MEEKKLRVVVIGTGECGRCCYPLLKRQEEHGAGRRLGA